jgi:ADP-sugar diphosphatase
MKFTALLETEKDENDKNSKADTLSGSIFMRGPSVGMLIILQPEDVNIGSLEERWVILTIQPRPAAGSLTFPELPAGMLDDAKTFKGAAAKEIQEETGLIINEESLINMSELAIEESDGSKSHEEEMPRAMFPSAGGCDEYIQLFLNEQRIPREELTALNNKLTGLREEGEKITLKLVRFEELWKEGARDAKALSALALYENLKRVGKIGGG